MQTALFRHLLALFLLSATCGHIPRVHSAKISCPCLKLRGGEELSSVQPTVKAKFQSSKEIPPYGWDQDREHLELYILVKGTSTAWGSSWKDHIQLHCSQRCIRVTISDLFGKDFELLLDGLYEEIATVPTKFQPKSDSLHIKFEKVISDLGMTCFCMLTKGE